MKKFLLAMLAVAMVSFGFVSCSNGDDDDDDAPAYAQYYGTYTGSMTVMKSTLDCTITVAADSLAYASTKMTGTYTNVAWTEDTAAKTWTITGYADEDTEKATAKATVVFDAEGNGTFTVVAMKAMGGNCSLTKK